MLIKVGLDDLELEPLTFAGLRYSLAALLLLPLAWRPLRASGVRLGDRRLLATVALLGLLLYTITQGAQFAALALLPAAAVSLVLTATPVLVALASGPLLAERPSALQAAGIAALLAGAFLYFGAFELGRERVLGLLLAALGLVANASSAVLGRSLVRDAAERVGGVLPLTALSMAVGGAALLTAGALAEPKPVLTPQAWLVIAWLAVVNTAFAFTLWNHTLRVLTAVESSVLNNTMLIQIALLAWLLLGESLGALQWTGVLLAAAGVLAVQLRLRPARAAPPLGEPEAPGPGAGGERG